jgi:tRNA dimethylallyltransferase
VRERTAAGRILALVGPTAGGKSAVALEVADRIDAEIVAVDAFTVYRGMDVGTAKSSAEDRARVAHHCLDLLDPDEACSVEWFQPQARAAIDDVLARGRTPLLVGGSGLYFRAVVDPLEFPPTDAEIRASLEERFAEDPPLAHRVLTEVDPESAARIDPSNLRRTIRALEVLELTGRPFSDWRRAWDTHRSVYAGLRVIGVDMGRAVLVRRIAQRVDAMVADGLVEECALLQQRYPVLSNTARQAIGYREIFDHLDGVLGLAEAVERTKVRTRRFSARQVRWFRADPRVRWAPPDGAATALAAAAGA